MNRSQTDNAPARNVRTDAFVAQMHSAERAALAQAIERQNMAEIERGDIARRIKQAREEAGLSQPEMAEAVGTHERTYQNYESVSKPRTPWGLMNDIAKVTGKTTEWLIHGDRPTPDLLGLAEHAQVSTGFVEFREHVDAIRADIAENRRLLEEARSERQRVAKLIEQQERILRRIEALAQDLPTDDALEAFRIELERAEERVAADEAADSERASAADRARRRRASGQ